MLTGEKIRLFRATQNLSQKDLANQLFVTYEQVSEWERNVTIPHANILFEIIKKYDLPLNYFVTMDNKDKIDKQIFKGFGQSIRLSNFSKPKLEEISRLSGISKRVISNKFSTYENLLYNFFNSLDDPIYNVIYDEVESLNKSEIIITIFTNYMLPYVYKKREIFKILYTRNYISEFWKEFIKIRYTRLIYSFFDSIDRLQAEYISEMLIGFISVWISQEEIEPLENLQVRVVKYMSGKIL